MPKVQIRDLNVVLISCYLGPEFAKNQFYNFIKFRILKLKKFCIE